MRDVTLIGRYCVFKHKGRWIVVRHHAHGYGCVSTHGTHATAVSAAKRYDEGDRVRAHAYRDVVRRFI